MQSTKRVALRDTGSRAVVPTRVLGVCRPRQIRAHAKLPKWDECYRYLVDEKQLPVLEPKVAQDLVASGAYVLVDVRPPGPYADSHPAGAVNVPLYQPLDWDKPDAAKVLKFIAYSFNGVQAVEPNPNFAAQLKAATAGGTKGIITVCEAGGTLKPSTNFPLGKPSRSLQAAYLALADEITNKVAHLDRGVYGWFQADLPFEGPKEYKPDVGRTPMAAKEPTLLTGYTMRQDDKK